MSENWSPSWKTREVRLAVWNKTNGRCYYCGAQTTVRSGEGVSTPLEFCIDHVIPQSLGGNHDLDNLVPSCRACNSSKGGRTLGELRVYLSWSRKFGFHIPASMREKLLSIGVELPTPEKDFQFYFERENLAWPKNNK